MNLLLERNVEVGTNIEVIKGFGSATVACTMPVLDVDVYVDHKELTEIGGGVCMIARKIQRSSWCKREMLPR